MTLDCYCDYDDDPPDFYSRRIVTAKTRHECYECGGIILPGEQYEYTSGKWDGQFDTFKICERCHDIRQWVQNNVPCLCWAFGHILEDCREAVEEASWRGEDGEPLGLRFGFARRIYALRKFNSERQKAAAQ
jgi:hypothetical protein